MAQMHVKAQVEERMAGLQRKLLLNEQLKLIKQELGIGENDRENIVEVHFSLQRDVALPTVLALHLAAACMLRLCKSGLFTGVSRGV